MLTTPPDALDANTSSENPPISPFPPPPRPWLLLRGAPTPAAICLGGDVCVCNSAPVDDGGGRSAHVHTYKHPPTHLATPPTANPARRPPPLPPPSPGASAPGYPRGWGRRRWGRRHWCWTRRPRPRAWRRGSRRGLLFVSCSCCFCWWLVDGMDRPHARAYVHVETPT